MSKLPSPKAFKAFIFQFINDEKAIYDSRPIDLEQYDRNLKKVGYEYREKIASKVYDLIHPIILKNDIEKNRNILRRYLGYSKKHNSLTITLYDEVHCPQTIVIRHSKDQHGNIVKWKTYGSKAFIPYRITNQPFVFTAAGMAEVLLFEILGVDYFLIQSDGVVRSLDRNPSWHTIRQLLNGKTVIYCLDNDESSQEAYQVFKKHYTNCFAIDFEMMWDRDLQHGYDFRDFCNQIAQEFDGKSRECQSRIYETIIISILLEVEKQLLCCKGGINECN